DGLYRYGLPPLRTRRSGRPGFGGWLRTLWQQFTDGPMWRGVASAAIATVLGLILLPAVSWFVRSIGMLAVPLVDADAVRIPGTGLVIGSQFAVVAGIVGILVSAAI